MNYYEFVQTLHQNLPPKSEIPNLKKGITTIINYNTTQVIYQRGDAKIWVNFIDLYDAYDHFKGKRVKTTDLKVFRSEIYSSKDGGHDCNCTFLFQFLLEAKKVDGIHGRGVAHDPFWVEISKD
jgi:hypothetical protein